MTPTEAVNKKSVTKNDKSGLENETKILSTFLFRGSKGIFKKNMTIETGTASQVFQVNWRNFGSRGGGYGNYRVDLQLVIIRPPQI